MARAPETLVIKKSKRVAHAHHGGAWKIAYADFVTAMMAFFLLLWLISMTTPEQKEGLANYFSPPNVSESTSGSGGILAGRSVDTQGALSAATREGGLKNPGEMQDPSQGRADGGRADSKGDRKAAPADTASANPQNYLSAAISIRQAWESQPDLTEVADNLVVEDSKTGLNIELLNQKGRPMFEQGSTYPFDWVRRAIAAIAPILQKLPNQIRISGHTASDAAGAGAWQLSSNRANEIRDILGEFGLTNDHVYAVEGKADTEPYFVDNPYMAANERVEITVLATQPALPLDAHP